MPLVGLRKAKKEQEQAQERNRMVGKDDDAREERHMDGDYWQRNACLLGFVSRGVLLQMGSQHECRCRGIDDHGDAAFSRRSRA